MIEALIIEGIPNRRISSQFGMSDTSIRRHVGNHFSATLAKATDAADVTRADYLMNKIQDLEDETRRVLQLMEKEGDHRGMLAAIGELRRLVELLAKLRGDIQEMASVNIYVTPAWIDLRQRIFNALEPYPDARYALVGELEDCDGDG